MGRAVEEVPPELLGDAAGNAESHGRAVQLVTVELPDPADDPLLGVLPYRARVDDEHVGRVGIVNAHVSLAPQHPAHDLRIGNVHLATVRFDVVVQRVYWIPVGSLAAGSGAAPPTSVG